MYILGEFDWKIWEGFVCVQPNSLKRKCKNSGLKKNQI